MKGTAACGLLLLLLSMAQVKAQGCGHETLVLEDFEVVRRNVSTYPPNSNCSWTVKSRLSGRSIVHMIQNINVGTDDGISTYDDTTPLTDGFNGYKTSRSIDAAKSGTLKVEFLSGPNTIDEDTGFEMFFMAGFDASAPCNEELTATDKTQYLTSPNFPDLYPVNFSCEWKIKAKDSPAVVIIEFKLMDMEISKGLCKYDYLAANSIDGNNTFFKVCGTNIWSPRQEVIDEPEFLLSLKSDLQKPKRGYVLSYKQERPQNSDPGRTVGGCDVHNCIVPIVVIIILIVIALIVVLIMVRKRRAQKYDTKKAGKSDEMVVVPTKDEEEKDLKENLNKEETPTIKIEDETQLQEAVKEDVDEAKVPLTQE